MDQSDTPSDATRHFEDLDVGAHRDLGSLTVTRAEIVEFAERFDPQSMHLEGGADSSLGELVASGWHTASLTMRLLVDGFLDDLAVIGGMGIDDLRWYKPVEPGDTLRAEVTVVEKEPWDDSRGQAQFRVHTYNQRDEEVMARTDRVLVARSDG